MQAISKPLIVALTLVLMAIPVLVKSQQDTLTTELDEQIGKKIEEIIDLEYVRIPRNDFDQLIESRISNEINNKVNTLIGVAIGLITILGALSLIQTNRTRSQLEKQIQGQVSTDTKKAIDEVRAYYQETVIKKIQEVEEGMEANLELIKSDNKKSLDKIQEQLEKAGKQVTKAEDYMTNLELEELDKLIIAQKYKYPEDLYRTRNLLKDIETSGKTELIPVVVELLSYIYYDQKMYNEVNDLITQYEDHYKLKPTTYVNGALTAIYDYHYFNSVNQRNRALEYLDKSLELTQGYGEALALKLEIYMIDYLRADEEPVRKEALSNAQKVLGDILKSGSYAPSYETASRLFRDNKEGPYKIYVTTLYNNFPQDLEKLISRANEGVNLSPNLDEEFNIEELKKFGPMEGNGELGA